MAGVSVKRFTLKGLADYMTAGHRRQRAILQSYKYPEEDESQAKILYYREARDRIIAYHRSAHTVSWLQAQALQLQSLAALSSPAAARRLEHNARALLDYAASFGGRVFKVLDGVQLSLSMGGIEISVRPDLHAIEKGAERLIKLELGASPLEAEEIKIMTQAMFEAATAARLGIATKDVVLFEVCTGKEHKGARLGASRRGEIEAACKSISAIWDSI